MAHFITHITGLIGLLVHAEFLSSDGEAERFAASIRINEKDGVLTNESSDDFFKIVQSIVIIRFLTIDGVFFSEGDCQIL